SRIKALARSLGFDPVGITTAQPFEDAERIALDRLSRGLMDGLPWYHAQRVRRGTHPEATMSAARSIISVALAYDTPDLDAPTDAQPRGRVSRYAWGADYHRVMREKSKPLLAALREMGAEARFSF